MSKTEQPPAGEFTKRFRDLIELSIKHPSKNKIGRLRTYGKEACYRIDRSEASQKDLLTACEIGFSYIQAIAHRIPRPLGDLSSDRKTVKAAIAIAKEKEVKI